MEATIVSVHGEARREVPPELAVFSVTVTAADRKKATVVDRLTRRAAEVGEILQRYSAVTETTGVQVNPELNRRGERAVHYSGTITTTVTVTDFGTLGELLAQVAAGELTSISGPWWQLRPGSRAGAEVRREAVTDALDRAREYASAVGSRLDRIIEIADEDTGGFHPMMRADMSAETAFDLSPQNQAVVARVHLKVTITDPVIS